MLCAAKLSRNRPVVDGGGRVSESCAGHSAVTIFDRVRDRTRLLARRRGDMLDAMMMNSSRPRSSG